MVVYVLSKAFMKRIKFSKYLFVLLAVACSSVTPLDKTLVTPERGKYQVGFKEFIWTDNTRDRAIKVVAWYPSFEPSEKTKYLAFEGFAKRDSVISDGKFPLIVVSHGTGGHRYNQFYMTEFLASFGYIVAAVEHPYNNAFDNDDQGSVRNLWNRPKDVSFVLTQLINDKQLSFHIDKEKIGFIGHSIGGYTGLVLAGAVPDFQLVIAYCERYPEDHLMCDTLIDEKENKTNYTLDFTNLRDHRIKTQFLMAPAFGQAFNSKNMVEVNVPIFLAASGRDEVLLKPHNIRRYQKALKGRIQFMEFPNAGHYVYLHECPLIVRILAGEACIDIGTPRAEIHPKLREISLAFFNKQLK